MDFQVGINLGVLEQPGAQILQSSVNQRIVATAFQTSDLP